MRTYFICIVTILMVASCHTPKTYKVEFLTDDVIEEMVLEITKNPESWNIMMSVQDTALQRLMELAHPEWGRPGYILSERFDDKKVVAKKVQALKPAYIQREYQAVADKLVSRLTKDMEHEKMKQLSESFMKLSSDFQQTAGLSDEQAQKVLRMYDQMKSKTDENRMIAEVEALWGFNYGKEYKAWMHSLFLLTDPAGGRETVLAFAEIFQDMAKRLAK